MTREERLERAEDWVAVLVDSGRTPRPLRSVLVELRADVEELREEVERLKEVGRMPDYFKKHRPLDPEAASAALRRADELSGRHETVKYCPDSPDHTCHHFSERDVDGKRGVVLRTGAFYYLDVDDEYDPCDENDEECLFCRQPEERK